ncbi:MAG: hypothetical protein M3Q64_00430 [bacterium]|nr:hypothetical protein [bacterium]
MSENTNKITRPIADVRQDLQSMLLVNSVIQQLLTKIVVTLTNEQITQLENQEDIQLPIIDAEIISLIKKFTGEDFFTFYDAMEELGASFGLSFDLTSAQSVDENQTEEMEYMFSMYSYIIIDPDDDDGGDDDDPVGEKKEVVKTMAKSAGV